MNFVEIAAIRSAGSVMMMMMLLFVIPANSSGASRCDAVDVATLLLCMLLVGVRMCQGNGARTVLRVGLHNFVRVVERVLTADNELQGRRHLGIDCRWYGN